MDEEDSVLKRQDQGCRQSVEDLSRRSTRADRDRSRRGIFPWVIACRQEGRLDDMASIPVAQSGSDRLAALLLRMSRKDEVAFELLYSSTKRKLFSTVLPIVRRRHLAEEVLQEAYVRIWLNAANYNAPLGSPMNWMITIARNLAIDAARRPVREIHSDDSALFNFPSDDPTALEVIEILEDQTSAFSQKLNVLYALRALNPKQRHLIIAAYIRGESRKQLSKRYGVPVNTIKTWIRRALLEVRANVLNAVISTPSFPGVVNERL
jgi:RNA polymerase sigma-70 factor, ECF subfamily